MDNIKYVWYQGVIHITHSNFNELHYIIACKMDAKHFFTFVIFSLIANRDTFEVVLPYIQYIYFIHMCGYSQIASTYIYAKYTHHI